MLKVYSTQTLLKYVKQGLSFRPEGKGFVLIVKGYLRLKINDEQGEFFAADLILLVSENIYSVVEYSDDLQLYIVSFNEKIFRQHVNFNFNRLITLRLVRGKIDDSDYRIRLTETEYRHLQEWIKQFEHYTSHLSSTDFKDRIIVSLGSVMAFALADKLMQPIQSDQAISLRKKQITLQFLNSANRHFAKERRLGFYADQLHISIKYLSNCVRDIAGNSPSRFLAEFTVNKSKELLLNTQKPIYQIAEDLHFSDPYAFGKFFKKHTGVNPSLFRRKNQDIDTI